MLNCGFSSTSWAGETRPTYLSSFALAESALMHVLDRSHELGELGPITRACSGRRCAPPLKPGVMQDGSCPVAPGSAEGR